MTAPRTVVQVLDNDLQVVGVLTRFYPLNKDGMILRYSKELSDWGTCLFRVSTKDPFLTQFGDILVPHQYHIRIVRDETVVWSGSIIANTDRNKLYVEVKGAEYDFYLDKVLIHRDASVTSGDGKENYATFSSGTMAAAITTLLNNAITDFGATSPMKNLTLSTIDNPDYPEGFVNASGVALTGAWSFTDFVTLQFDYHSVYYVLKAFGVYVSCDFEIDEDMVFTWKKFIGNKNNNLVFTYGNQGNIVDYSNPRHGERMTNDLWGIAADNAGNVLHVEQSDSASRNTYGLLQTAQAFVDVKDKNFLKDRVNQTLKLVKDPDVSALSVILDEKGYPLGQYDIGDIVTIKIADHVIDFDQAMRIVGITVNLHETGRELTTLQTNLPDPLDIGA
jgi:hypothetical protein